MAASAKAFGTVSKKGEIKMKKINKGFNQVPLYQRRAIEARARVYVLMALETIVNVVYNNANRDFLEEQETKRVVALSQFRWLQKQLSRRAA